jgi:hypothetical protein
MFACTPESSRSSPLTSRSNVACCGIEHPRDGGARTRPYIVCEMEGHNPLIPPVYDIVWSVVAAASVVLIVIAIVSLSRKASQLSPVLALAWAALILVVPVLGPVAWLAVGRRGLLQTRARTRWSMDSHS